MPQPFNVRSQDKPGTDLGNWDALGNITIPGTLTAANVVNQGGGASSGVQSVTNADGTVTVTGTATAPVVSLSAAEVAVIAAKAPINNASFTGTTAVSQFSIAPDTITYAAAITPDCSTGNLFRVTLTGGLAVNAPINMVDGQKILFEFIQDGTGSRAIALNAVFKFGVGTFSITAYFPTATINKRDFLGAVYNASTGFWYVVALAQGY